MIGSKVVSIVDYRRNKSHAQWREVERVGYHVKVDQFLHCIVRYVRS